MDAITKRRLVTRLATELLGALDETLLAALRELAEVNHTLHEAGIDYPTGARGVADLYGQRDSQIERAEEAERELAALKADFEAKVIQGAKDLNTITSDGGCVCRVPSPADPAPGVKIWLTPPAGLT